MKFSPSTRGFYLEEFNRDIPEDAVDIDVVEHEALMAAQGQGKVIVAAEDGQPVAVDRIDSLTAEEALAELRVERDRLLAASDYTQFPDAPLTIEQRNAWSAYRQALRDLPAATPDPKAPVWPIAPDHPEEPA